MEIIDALIIFTPVIIALIVLFHTLLEMNTKESNNNINNQDDLQDDFEYSFISERPKIHNDKNPLLFGHKELVETLDSIVENCPKNKSLSLGLYGDWGSGKSSIVETLQKNLISRKVPLVLFDVWKHEGDALRRAFIRHLDKELKSGKLGAKYLDKEEKLDENLDKSLKEVITTKPKWQVYLKELVIWGSILPLAAVILATLIWLVFDKAFDVLDFKKDDLDTSIGILISLFPVSFLSKLLLKTSENLKGEKKEYFKEAYKDPIEFEDAFTDILIKLRKKKYKKLVIGFDNLDRVSGENAIKVISTIKTFLEPVDKEVKGIDVVFIIPCDENAIKKHLASVFIGDNIEGYDIHQYTTEYLRKFFNTVIRIPKFNEGELENYAWTLLKQTKIKHFKNRELSSLIATVFRDNPRQIVQFINTLISYYILFRNREKTGKGIEKNFLENNTIPLAKYLLFEYKFPTLIGLHIEYKKYDINYYIENKKDCEEHLKLKGKKFNEGKYEEFKELINLTNSIYIESLEIFIKARTSPNERKFQDGSKLIEVLSLGYASQFEDADAGKNILDYKNYIDGLKLEEKKEDFTELILEKLLSKRNNPADICRFINGVFHLTGYLKLDMNETILYERIAKYFGRQDVLIQTDYIDFDVMSKQFLEKYDEIDKNIKGKIINQWSIMAADKLEGDE